MYCHNFFVSEELFSCAQAEGFTVRLLTDEGERGVAFGLSFASVKVVDGECVYFCSGPLMSMVSYCSVYYAEICSGVGTTHNGIQSM